MRAGSDKIIQRVIELLAHGRYQELESLTGAKHLTAEQISDAVKEYGRSLIMPPFDRLDVDAIRVGGKQPTIWSVRIPLWSREEGRSDLTLEMTIKEHADRSLIEIDGIHVL